MNLNLSIESYIEAKINEKLNNLKEDINDMFSKMNNKEYLSIKETAKYLGVSDVTLWNWHKDNVLRKHYIAGVPRYKKSDIDNFFNQQNNKYGNTN